MANNFCEKCGSRIEENSKFCMKCGNRLEFAQEKIETDIINNADIDDVISVEAEVDSKLEKPKKASYKAEIITLIISVICLIGAGVFFALNTTYLDDIAVVSMLKYSDNNFVGEANEKIEDVPVLTAEMAEEIINNSYWCFPYHHFYGKGLLNENDYIIHPFSSENYDIKCYTAKGIDTLDDYFAYFEKYATRDFIEESMNKECFVLLKDSKPYFVPNEWMGWYPTSASALIIEKIDIETYYVTTSFWSGEELIIKYIDGNFKVTTITPQEAFSVCASENETVTIPDISDMSIDEAEVVLKNAGLTLNRDDLTYVVDYCFFDDERTVFSAKFKHKKVAPGSSIGIYVAVEVPDFYRRGATNGKDIPELSIDEAIKIYRMTSDSLYSSFSLYDLLDKENSITVDYYSSGLYTAYPIKGVETLDEFNDMMSVYVASNTYYAEPYMHNGKPYVIDTSNGDYTYNGASDFSLVKYDDATYFLYEQNGGSESVIIYVDGAFRMCSSYFTPEDVKNIE